ncbi:hypothetical protein ACFPGO_02065 [Arcanobacterium canis]|uniref:Transposase n=1 Tax=Arcanobacterium canis TaxID=999183 RepID=A0ABY8G274_9ACTO|nr:hypothetical protein [Arcanobacterium canis]WFM82904.1 hypothetical protein P7079_05740 [Arcanobacterium canis]
MSKEFDQDAKDGVVRLVEDRFLVEGVSIQAACEVVVPQLGVCWIRLGSGSSKPDVQVRSGEQEKM